MPIFTLVIVLILIGVGLYLVNNVFPMAPSIKTILNVVVVIVVCLWLLQVFGLADAGPRVGRGGCETPNYHSR
jgi:hypothetical protein